MLLRLSVSSVFLISAVLAQSPLGNVSGVALDPSGSPIPEVTLKLAHQETNLERETRTNSAGAYLFPNLAPGTYKLTASSKGFRNYETVAFHLEAYRTVRQDIRFDLATATTEVTVNGSADTLLQLETAAIGSRLTGRQLNDLPTNLRSVFNNAGDSGLIFQMLPLTIPGVVQVGAGATWLTPGGTANSMKLKVDGIDTTFGNFGSPDSVSQPSFEAIEEFSASIHSNKAEFGGLGVVSSVTKSGGNRFHGGLFEFARNSAFDARNAFLLLRPYQNIHNYGGSFGGPIVKNKTFFQFTADATKGSRAYSFTSSVPSLAFRSGDFSALTTVVRDPYTTTPLPNNKVPANLLSSVGLKAQDQFYPLPNFGPPNLLAGNYRASFAGPEFHKIFEFRLDHNWSSPHSSFGRYQNRSSDYDIPGVRGELPPSSLGTSKNHRHVNFVTLGDMFSIRPNLFNEFRAGGLVLVSYSTADLKGQALNDKLGITGLPRRDINGIPNLSISGFSSVAMRLLNPVNDGHTQISDTLTWVRGKHTVKGGVEFIHWAVNRYFPVDPAAFGNFNFSGRFSNNAYADFLMGLPNTVTRLDPYPTQYFRWNDLSWFVQDDFKVTPRLTLSYGLRYEYNQPLSARDGNIYSFDMRTGSIVIPNDASRKAFSPYFPTTFPIVTAAQANLPETLRSADKNNFAPRLGFSYAMGQNSRTVIRGGWGVYYNHYSGAVGGTLAAGPFAVSTTANNAITNGKAAFDFASPFAAPGASSTLNLNAISADLYNGYTMQYSVSAERQLWNDFLVRGSYIGSRGVGQVFQRNVNQPLPSNLPFSATRRPFPRFNNIVMAENGAYNDYNSLQLTAAKRFSKGLQFTSAFTLARDLSEVDDTGNADLNTAIENAYDRRRDRGDVSAVPRKQWMNQVLYELPLGKNKFLKGWQTNFLVNFQSGTFVNPQWAGADPAGIGAAAVRPDLNSTLNYPGTLTQWYDRSAFTVPASGTFGNAKRNTLVTPGFALVNFGIAKSTTFERFGTIQLSATFLNAVNHLNYGSPNATVNNVNGGVITSSHAFLSAGSARTGQLGLRWMF